VADAPDKSPARIAAMFDAIAGRYDFLNHALSAGLDHRWRARAVRELRLRPGAHVVDLCTGTADLAIAAATAVSDARIVGVDFAGAMLALGAVAAQDATNVVTIDNFTFTPPELTVVVGTTVKWVNRDDIPHLVVNKDKAFRSKALDTGDSFSYTFASAGTFDYFCALHPHMVGKVIVK